MTALIEHFPPNRAIHLHNVYCTYCNRPLDDCVKSRDHVIGRRFVPKGKLNNQWNLIVKSCERCNNHKAGLEDDISAITMLPDLFGEHGHDDETAKDFALHKAARSNSRRTGKLIRDSLETMKVEAPFCPGVTFTFTFTAPPQLDENRIFELARLQLMGFFQFITFNKEQKRGFYWPGGFYPIMASPRRDWGNPLMRGFADAVVGWPIRFFGSTADGFFKIAMRKHPDTDCWSWALEWNHTTRVIGFFGQEDAIRPVADNLPKIPMHTIVEASGALLRHRIEQPLDKDDDRLFFWDDGTEGEAMSADVEAGTSQQ